MVTRIVLVSHDSVGLGHVRRNLAIAHALSEALPALTGEEVSGLLITGQASATSFETPPKWDWLVVPGLTTGADGYRPRHLDLRLSTLTAIRGRIIGAALREFEPDLVIVDRHALGVNGELEGGLAALRKSGRECAVVLGLREVLDRPQAMKAEWAALDGANTVRRLFDAVWIYGDPTVHDAIATGEVPRYIADLAVHTGYLANGRRARKNTPGEKPYVLTMVGGGSDGRAVAEAAARAKVPDGHRHIIVTGPQMPDSDRRSVRAMARKNTSVIRSVPDALSVVRGAAAVVCMGGYNSVAEVMSTTVPALVIPRANRRFEQRIRAASLAKRGLVDVVHQADLTPKYLTSWFARNAGGATTRDGVDLDGLATVAPLAATLLRAAAERTRIGALRAV